MDLVFAGSHLSEELVNQGHDITILDNLSNGQLSNISKIKDKVTVYIAQVEQLQSTIFNDQFDGSIPSCNCAPIISLS